MQDEFKAAARKTALSVAAAACFGLALNYAKSTTAALEFAWLLSRAIFIRGQLIRVHHALRLFQSTEGVPGKRIKLGHPRSHSDAGRHDHRGRRGCSKIQVDDAALRGDLVPVGAIKLLLEGDDDDEDEINDRLVMRIARRVVGATAEYDGDRFFTTQHKDGKSMRAATPCYCAWSVSTISDVVFAVDSIPAVLGISTDPLVVYSSNIFAIIGLRALYTLVARAVDSLTYLKHAVCAVLVFIALKMIGEYFDYHLSTGFSLCVVGSLLALGVLVSCVVRPRKKRKDDKDDGMLQYPHGFEPPSPLYQRGHRGASVSKRATICRA